MAGSRCLSTSDTPWATRIGREVNGSGALPKSSEEWAPTADIEALDQQVQQAYAMLDLVRDAVISTDIESNITYMNQEAEKLTGFSRQDSIGRPLQEIFQVIDMNTRRERADFAQQAMETDCAIELHIDSYLITRQGQELAIEDSETPLYNADQEVIGALVIFHDARYSPETAARMTYLAQHDALTGLLNRHAFTERFHQEAASAQRHKKKMMLLFIDLDDFKELNDSLGHSSGDAVLKTLGQRFLECVRVTDHVCRHGGDEFVVLLSDIEKPEQAFSVVDKLHSAAKGLRLKGRDISLKLSIGASVYPDDGDSLDTLLPHADSRMYRVKASNKQGETRSNGVEQPIYAVNQ